MTFWNRALGAALLIACVAFPAAQANVLVGGTRVILPAKEGEVTVRLTNDNDRPALVQAWIDRGDAKATPDTVDTPFLVTPPMFRMEPGRDQSLRILYTKEPLPADRESLFWLNVLEVPPKPADMEAASTNYLQLALRSRLKLFYRPQNLAGDPATAPEQLAFRAGAAGELVVSNPTPYYITLYKLTVAEGGRTFEAETGMVEPMGELRLRVAQMGKAAASAAVSYSAINDYGTPTPSTSRVTP